MTCVWHDKTGAHSIPFRLSHAGFTGLSLETSHFFQLNRSSVHCLHSTWTDCMMWRQFHWITHVNPDLCIPYSVCFYQSLSTPWKFILMFFFIKTQFFVNVEWNGVHWIETKAQNRGIMALFLVAQRNLGHSVRPIVCHYTLGSFLVDSRSLL